MLGELIIAVLELILGYLYPALQCFKAIEIRGPGADRLLFWCQYWVIIAAVTALEKFGELFVSWVPLYGEAKLAFIVFLWHPKTKGTSYVFNVAVRPFMAQHEPDIEKRVRGMVVKTGQVLAFYVKHFADKSQSVALDILDRVITRPPPQLLTITQSVGSCAESSPPDVDEYEVYSDYMMPFDHPMLLSPPPKKKGGGGFFKRWRKKRRHINTQFEISTITSFDTDYNTEVDEETKQIQELLQTVGVELPPPPALRRT